jgi:hypothetical protein
MVEVLERHLNYPARVHYDLPRYIAKALYIVGAAKIPFSVHSWSMHCVNGLGFYSHWQIGIPPRESNGRVERSPRRPLLHSIWVPIVAGS